MADRIKRINVQAGRDSGETQYGIQSEVTDEMSISTSIFGGPVTFKGSGDYLEKVANNGQLISTGYVYSLGRRVDSYYTIELGGKNKECNTISSMSSSTTLAALQTNTEFTPERKTGASITCKPIPGCKYNLVLNYGYPEFNVNIDDLKGKLYNGQEMFIVFDNHTDNECILKWDRSTTVSDYVLMGGIEDGELTIQPQRYETMSIMLLNGTYFICCGGGGVIHNGTLTFEFDIDHFYTYENAVTPPPPGSKTYNIVFTPTPGAAKVLSNDKCTITATLKCATDSSVNISIPMDAFTYVDDGVTHTTSGTSTVVNFSGTAGSTTSITLNYNWSDIFSKCGITNGSNTGTGTAKYTFDVITQNYLFTNVLKFGEIYFSWAFEEYSGGRTGDALNPIGKCYDYDVSSSELPEDYVIKMKQSYYSGYDRANAFYLNFNVNVKETFYGDAIFDTSKVTINILSLFATAYGAAGGAFENIQVGSLGQGYVIPKGVYANNDEYGYQIANSDTEIRSKTISQMYGTNHLLSVKFADYPYVDFGVMSHQQINWDIFSTLSLQNTLYAQVQIKIKTTDGSGDVSFIKSYKYKVDFTTN